MPWYVRLDKLVTEHNLVLKLCELKFKRNNQILKKVFNLTLVKVAAEVEDEALLSQRSFSHTLSLSFSLQLSPSLSLTLLILVLHSAVVVSLFIDCCGGDFI